MGRCSPPLPSAAPAGGSTSGTLTLQRNWPLWCTFSLCCSQLVRYRRQQHRLSQNLLFLKWGMLHCEKHLNCQIAWAQMSFFFILAATLSSWEPNTLTVTITVYIWCTVWKYVPGVLWNLSRDPYPCWLSVCNVDTETTLKITGKTKSPQYSSLPTACTWRSWLTAGERFISSIFWISFSKKNKNHTSMQMFLAFVPNDFCLQSSSDLGAGKDRDGDADEGRPRL